MLDLGTIDGLSAAVGLDLSRWRVASVVRTTHNGRPALLIDALYRGERVQIYAEVAGGGGEEQQELRVR